MSAQQDAERLANDVARLRKQAADESTKVARARKQEADARASASRSSSAGTIASRLRESDRYAGAAIAAEKKRAEFDVKAADKEKQMYAARAKADKDRLDVQKKQDSQRDRAQQTAIKNLEASLRREQQQARVPAFNVAVATESSSTPSKKYDVFISHASEDKDAVARPLAKELSALGLEVWFDEATLTVGDSLRRKIDEGLANSRFGLVILSRSFFEKQWPQAELDALYSRQMSGDQKVILPVWHEISKDEILKAAPTLADLLGLQTALLTVAEIAAQVAAVVNASSAE